MKFQKVFLFSLIIGQVPSFAQTTLGTINVSAKKTTLAATSESDVSSNESFDQQAIDLLQSQSLDDLLKLSVSSTTLGGPRSSGEALSIRGLKAGKLFLYVDGMAQRMQTDHSSMLALEMEDIARVTIYSDSQAEVGSSIGGGASFETKDATHYLSKKDKAAGEMQVSVQGANKEKMTNAKVMAREEDYDIYLSATKRKADDTVLANKETLTNSSYEDENFLFKANLPDFIEDQKLTFQVQRFQRTDTVPLNPSLNPPKDLYDLQGNTKQQRLSYKIEHNAIFDNLSIKTFAYDQKNRINKIRQSDSEEEQRVIQTKSLSTNLIYNYEGLYTLKTGATVLQYQLEGSKANQALPSYADGKARELNFYAKADARPAEFLTLGLSARTIDYKMVSANQDFEQKDISEINYSSYVEFDAYNKAFIKLSYGEGTNNPRLQDVFADGLHRKSDNIMFANNYFIPNLDLETERSKKYEIQGKIETNLFSSYDRLKLQYSQYWSYVDNYITTQSEEKFVFDYPETGTTQFVNIENVKLKGRELTLGYANDYFDINMTYARYRGINVNQALLIETMPADQYTFNTQAFIDNWGLTLGYLGQLALKQDRQNRDVLQREQESPSYFVHNIYAKKDFLKGTLKGLTITSGIDNLTNRKYRKYGSHIMEAQMNYKMKIGYIFKI
ncbi:TonB-dependent receptor plug domain-containing protein [Halobacteriovorax sp. GB3]|uniref:TonB-dependent receptor plug domain-containing protein n=1 Tax=Halobacteriovorax sp. GB3 TaxID=2719615 RepID=UPI00236010D7|nr:TonB-dependent receptor plug domain-containing protein [Halobacteriovorax sp. GB3]MDD0852776.1 TonB-dependent receptor plug domain-containing protein [Halobacteriovorax sp. GB3]